MLYKVNILIKNEFILYIAITKMISLFQLVTKSWWRKL